MNQHTMTMICAKIGATVRLAEIQKEMDQLVAAFPDLDRPERPEHHARQGDPLNMSAEVKAHHQEVKPDHTAQTIARTRKIGTVDVHVAHDAPPRRQKAPQHHMSDAARKAQARRMRARWRAFHASGRTGQLRAFASK